MTPPNPGMLPGFDLATDGARVIALLDPEKSPDNTLLHGLLNVDSELRRSGHRAPN